MGKIWCLACGCCETWINGWWLWCYESQVVVIVDWFGFTSCGGFVVGVGWLVCLCLVSVWPVGSVDDFGLGCDLGFVCVWSNFVIWVFVCFLFFFFRLCSCDLGLSSWLLGLCSCNLDFSSWLLGLIWEEHEEQVIMFLRNIIMKSNNFFLKLN